MMVPPRARRTPASKTPCRADPVRWSYDTPGADGGYLSAKRQPHGPVAGHFFALAAAATVRRRGSGFLAAWDCGPANAD